MTTPLQLANYFFPNATSVTPVPNNDPEEFRALTGAPRDDYANVYAEGTAALVDGKYIVGLRPVLSQHGGIEAGANGEPTLIPVWNEIPERHPWRTALE